MKKFTLTVITAIYILLVIAIASVFISEFLLKEKPEERFFEVPQVSEPVVASAPQEVKKAEPKFIPAPKTELKYIKGAVINPRTKNLDYISAIGDAKKLGTNLITIALEMEVDEKGGIEFSGRPRFDWKSAAIAMINEAHRQGMQVELRTIAVPDTRQPRNATGYVNYAGKFFAELGDFADEYQVYMLTVYENMEDEHNMGLYKDSINPALKVILGNATRFFSGEIGVGFSDSAHIEEKKLYDISGYDYLILNSYPVYNKVAWGELHLRIGELVQATVPLKKQQGIRRVILGGFGVNSDKTPPYYMPLTTTQENEKLSYEKIFEQQANKTDGFTVAYATKVYGVKGSLAEQTVKEWYGKI